MTELGPMQEKFEAWMGNPLDLKKNADGKYLDLETCAYWITWQEAFEAGRSSLESENERLREALKEAKDIIGRCPKVSSGILGGQCERPKGHRGGHSAREGATTWIGPGDEPERGAIRGGTNVSVRETR